jgi:ABC-type bacteriocin/lantibiotic exporter with double-glycine peptidase domain
MTGAIVLPHHPQSAEGLCLAACVRMVLARWDTIVSEDKVAELLGIREWGVPASAIRHLSQWGWNVEYGHGAPVDLAPWLQKGIPVITFVRTGFLGHWTKDVGHAVVVAGITAEGVYLYDPVMERAPQIVSQIGFEAAWTEMDYGYAVITPAVEENR